MASAAGLPAAAPSRPRLRILCLHSFRTRQGSVAPALCEGWLLVGIARDQLIGCTHLCWASTCCVMHGLA